MNRDLLVAVIRELKALESDGVEEGNLILEVRKLWKNAKKAVEGLPESTNISLFLNAISAGMHQAAQQAAINVLRDIDGKPSRGL